MGPRTIIVGDVHGCRRELERLLERVSFSSGDRLVFVGDLIARGPDSLGVLDIVRRTGALMVRGNHEQKLLDWREDDGVVLGRTHIEVARSLRDVDWSLLETSPLWIDLPEHGARVVHAGVLPGVAIEKQEPHTLMHIRTVGVRGSKIEREGERNSVGLALSRAAANRVRAQRARWFANASVGDGARHGVRVRWRLTAMVLAEGERIPLSIARRRGLLVTEPAARAYFEPPKRFRAA